jgi:exopolyphosphatase / guanosine-5'-triphosphate,3'-diphosphate pyrophosphatase
MGEQCHFRPACSLSPLVERRAVIDIGANSVNLLVADLGETLSPVLKLSLQTSLGHGTYQTQRLRPDAIGRAVDAVADLAAEAVAIHSSSIQVLATSTARDATNGREFIQAVQCATGLRVDVITPNQEADYVFQGVTSDPEIGHQLILIVDVGGSSTRWVVGENGSPYFRQCIPLGTARLLELQPPGDPPTQAALATLRATVTKFIQTEVDPVLRPVLQPLGGRTVRLVALGGALRALAQISSTPAPTDARKLHFLHREQLVAQLERLWRLSLPQRRHILGTDSQKADVILPGAVIHEAILGHFGFEGMLLSSLGLREGALLSHPARSASTAVPSLPSLAAMSLGEPGGWEIASPPSQTFRIPSENPPNHQHKRVA